MLEEIKTCKIFSQAGTVGEHIDDAAGEVKDWFEHNAGHVSLFFKIYFFNPGQRLVKLVPVTAIEEIANKTV